MSETINEQGVRVFKPSFPVGVALVGAPESGKSKIIKEFMVKATPWFEEQGSKLNSLPNAGLTVEKKYDRATGNYGSWREDLWVGFQRLSEESASHKNGKSTVSSGTWLDCMAHAGVGLETAMIALQSGLVTPQDQMRIQEAQQAIGILTMLFANEFRYHFAFFVPYMGKIVLEGDDAAATQDHFSKRINDALLTIMENFGIRLQVLDQPSYEERADEMLSVVKRIVTEGVEIQEPSPVAESEDTPESFGEAVTEVLDDQTDDEDGGEPALVPADPKPNAPSEAAVAVASP